MVNIDRAGHQCREGLDRASVMSRQNNAAIAVYKRVMEGTAGHGRQGQGKGGQGRAERSG